MLIYCQGVFGKNFQKPCNPYGIQIMPRPKGSKNKTTNRSHQVGWFIDESLYAKLEAIARKKNLINHRNGAGDRSALLKLFVENVELFDGLGLLENAIALNDWDAVDAAMEKIKSWGEF